MNKEIKKVKKEVKTPLEQLLKRQLPDVDELEKRLEHMNRVKNSLMIDYQRVEIDSYEHMDLHIKLSQLELDIEAIEDKIMELKTTPESSKVVFAISGKARHGKDTVAEILEEQLGADDVLSIAFADHLKEIAYYVGWDGEKDERGRNLLQELSHPIKHYHGLTYFADVVANRFVKSNKKYFIATDTRHKFEAERMAELQEEGMQVFLIRVERPETDDWKSPLNKEQRNDISEIDMDDYNGALEVNLITNDGSLEDLENKVRQLLLDKGIK